MQPHPAELAAAWYAQACDDLLSARALLEAERFGTCCFLSQQAAEKALKALLNLLGGDHPRTHTIAGLVNELARLSPTLDLAFREATALDPFYVSTRYPDAIGGAIPAASFHRAEAELALQRARDVVDVVATLLPKADDGQG